MRFLIILSTAFFFLSSQLAISQNIAEKEAINKVILLETASFMKRDSVTWKDQFIQNEKTTWVYSAFTIYQNQVGWNNFAPMMLDLMKALQKPSRYTDIKHSNKLIHISEDLAWVAYDQALSIPGIDSIAPTGSREFRTLIKENGRWKISSIMTIDTTSHVSTDAYRMENIFNILGYRYLEDDMIDQAVEVFKLNVKLYPTAWNTYDSLGEAYALAGNKDLAIANYKKSIELNPENHYGKTMLAKLTGE